MGVEDEPIASTDAADLEMVESGEEVVSQKPLTLEALFGEEDENTKKEGIVVAVFLNLSKGINGLKVGSRQVMRSLPFDIDESEIGTILKNHGFHAVSQWQYAQEYKNNLKNRRIIVEELKKLKICGTVEEIREKEAELALLEDKLENIKTRGSDPYTHPNEGVVYAISGKSKTKWLRKYKISFEELDRLVQAYIQENNPWPDLGEPVDFNDDDEIPSWAMMAGPDGGVDTLNCDNLPDGTEVWHD